MHFYGTRRLCRSIAAAADAVHELDGAAPVFGRADNGDARRRSVGRYEDDLVRRNGS